MKILFIIATAILVYMYWVELINPWLLKRKERNKQAKEALERLNKYYSNALALDSEPTSVKSGAALDINDVLVYSTGNIFYNKEPLAISADGTLTVQYPTVNINQPVLLVGKADNLKIYYPDNTVELFSGKRWKKYKTPHKSVYSYAALTKSTILENLG